jgi:hypothetical protein
LVVGSSEEKKAGRRCQGCKQTLYIIGPSSGIPVYTNSASWCCLPDDSDLQTLQQSFSICYDHLKKVLSEEPMVVFFDANSIA